VHSYQLQTEENMIFLPLLASSNKKEARQHWCDALTKSLASPSLKLRWANLPTANLNVDERIFLHKFIYNNFLANSSLTPVLDMDL